MLGLSGARGKLEPNRARDYAMAGRAVLTLVSVATGGRFTFKIQKGREGGADAPRFVSVLTGPNNSADYQFLGTIFADGTFRHGRRSSLAADAPAVRAFAWWWEKVAAGRLDWAAACEAYHEGRCGRCGRPLTVPESVSTGLGPTCAERTA